MVEGLAQGRPSHPKELREATSVAGARAPADCPPQPPACLSRIGLLTEQQRRVFVHLSEGLTNKQIARRLGLHESTVKVHVSAVLAKLECPNRTTAALVALYHRLQPLFVDGCNHDLATKC